MADEEWDEWITEELLDLRLCHGDTQGEFARRVGVDRRTVQRWESGQTTPTDRRVIARLSELASQCIAKKAPWMLDPQGALLMNRRDALRLLAGGAAVSVPGVLAAARQGVSDTQLDHVEATTTTLAGANYQVAPQVLLAPVGAHLEEASRLLQGSMLPRQRNRLLSLTGDLAVFVAYLAIRCDRLGQADAYLRLACSRAGEAEDRALLSEIFCAQGYLCSAVVHGGRQGDPKTAIALLEQAARLAVSAPGWVRAHMAARLAEERATAMDADGSDEAFDTALRALDGLSGPPMPASGFCSTSGWYAHWPAASLDGHRGVCDVLLNRPERAVPVLQTRLGLPLPPLRRAITLTDLGAALASQDQPEEGAACLNEAHDLNEASGHSLGHRRILGACERLKSVDTPAVRQLFGRLHLPPRSGAWS